METEIIVRIVFTIGLLGLGVALLVYNVKRKVNKIKSELRRADVRRRAILAAERS